MGEGVRSGQDGTVTRVERPHVWPPIAASRFSGDERQRMSAEDRAMVGGGPFDLPAGAWTDDTSMALCLAESILDTGEMDLAD